MYIAYCSKLFCTFFGYPNKFIYICIYPYRYLPHGTRSV